MGPTENDAVVSIANGMWRKARLQKFLRAKILECKFDASHPAYDEPRTLRAFSADLEFADCLDELLSSPLLSEKRKEHFKRKFPSLERCDEPVEGSFLEATTIVGLDDFKNEIALEERIDAM